MKHGKQIAHICFLCILFILTACGKNEIVFDAAKFAEVEKQVQHGDLIFRHGDGFFSDQILSYNESNDLYSHVGIVSFDRDGIYVIHADTTGITGDGVVVRETLKTFFSHSKRIGIYRPKNNNQTVFTVTAAAYIGRLFDWKFNHDDDSALYCTELVFCALKESNPHLYAEAVRLCRNNRFIPVDTFTSPAIADFVYDSGRIAD